MNGWNFGDILDETAAALTADRPAVIHDDKTVLWSDFDRRSNNLAKAFIEQGLKPGDRVAFYHRNGVEYPELLAAAFKARLTHVNINYRYKDEELAYILKDSGARIVSYDAEFAPVIERLKDQFPDVAIWLQAGDAAPGAYAQSYETLAETGDGARLDIERSGDDILLLYTGGTTGMPKGVVWTHDTLRRAQLAALAALGPAPMTMEEHRKFIAELTELDPFMPACPWMHGTGLSTALANMCFARPIVTIDSSHGLDAPALWRAVEAHRVAQIAIVGDAFAKPMMAALKEMPDTDVLSLNAILSSGAMWSREVKAEMLERMPQIIIADLFGSSETLGFGASFSTVDTIADTATIVLGPDTIVMKDDETEAGVGETGMIAIKGAIGAGYFGDDKKTKTTYKEINGETWCVPGDFANVLEGGAVTLLGRGSNCINTAGEKVFPEEVEEVLKLYDGVKDALVVGVPDEKWGNAVVAIVTSDNLYHGDNGDEAPLRDFVAEKLARYKSPKQIFFVSEVLRGPNGKADYVAARAIAESARGAV